MTRQLGLLSFLIVIAWLPLRNAELKAGPSVDNLQLIQLPQEPVSSKSFPCPVTTPNIHPNKWGNDALVTTVFRDGEVVFRPGGPGIVLQDGALSMKWPWWRVVPGQLTITGRRLDGLPAPLRARIPNGYGEIGFQPVALVFPAPGCWEVTGRVANASLTFVTRVVRTGEVQNRAELLTFLGKIAGRYKRYLPEAAEPLSVSVRTACG